MLAKAQARCLGVCARLRLSGSDARLGLPGVAREGVSRMRPEVGDFQVPQDGLLPLFLCDADRENEPLRASGVGLERKLSRGSMGACAGETGWDRGT